ncbi:g10577 [Coccomyxa elongata]
MNEMEVERQIDQMVSFIKQEAEEKANEIAVSAEEDFNIEKLQLLESEKAKIRKEYERREGQIEVKKKIEFSKQLNESRIKVLQAKESSVHGLVKEAHSHLLSLSGNKKQYKSLLTDLTIQALYKLGEPKAVVKVRKEDLSLIKEVVEPARTKFNEVYGQPAPEVTVDEKKFLPPAPKSADDEESESCTGGVVVSSANGLIVCSNTLDERLRIAYTQTLPDIRTSLFGAVQRA